MTMDETQLSTQTRNYTSLAAVVFLVWESFVTCQNEYIFIWRGPFTTIKCIYLFSRYFGLGAQIVNHVIMTGPISRFPVKSETCRIWFGFQSLAVEFLLTAVNLVLMLRVYALYNQSRRICIFLALLLFVDQTVTYYVYFALLRRLRFDISCMVPDTPRYVFYYGALILTTQSIIWSMTLFKRKLRSRAGGIMAPVIHLMMRDGAIVFLAICGIFMVSIPYSIVVQSAPHIIFSWPISILSTTACRLVMNMQRLRTAIPSGDGEQTSTPGVILTTYIEDSFDYTSGSSLASA